MTDNRKEQASDWREARRLQAWELTKKGWAQSRIAEALGVSRGAVSQWIKAAREGGVEALRHRKGGGPCPRLTEEQLNRLPELLAKGAEAYGFRGDVWTRARVGVVIEQEFGVSYTPQHVGRLLDKINWSRQKPVEQASQRDEAAIERWRTEKWREVKKKPKSRAEP
jgi:transposase